MKKSILITVMMTALLLVSSVFACAQDVVDLGKGWAFEESITIPVLKIVDVGSNGSEAQAELYTGLGGGICFSYQKELEDGNKHRIFTISPFTILLSGEEGEDDTTVLNIAYAMTAGFFDDKIMVGIGRDFGKVEDRSRWFAMLSLGVTFN